MKSLLPLSIAAIAIAAALSIPPATAERAVPVPAIATDVPPTPGLATAVLAGGCFWGMEAVFERVKGVKSVVSGYAGGAKGDATYDRVSTERTGHAEAIRITYARGSSAMARCCGSISRSPTIRRRSTANILIAAPAIARRSFRRPRHRLRSRGAISRN